jgi:hypothetical protein
MENYQKIVSSRGILRSCDLFNPVPQSGSPYIDFGKSSVFFSSGGAIYCCTDALENFANNVIDDMYIPFVLVSGDADTVVSPRTLGNGVFEKILAHPTLLRWHAQNLGARGEKLHFLPIGLDYHTMWERPGYWGDTVSQSPSEQENVLLAIRNGASPAQDRKCLIYCNWHFALHDRGSDGLPRRSERIECLEQIDRSLCFFEPALAPRYSTWARQAEYSFVLSPSGNGPDTHRLWEALVLGCIPIVKRNFLLEFLSDLPVVVVDDWKEITATFLQKSLAGICAGRFNFAKLYLEYWRRAIRGAAQDDVPMMTMLQYQAGC